MNLADEFTAAILGAENPFRSMISYTANGAAAKSIYAIVNHGGNKKVSSKVDKMPVMYEVTIVISISAAAGIETVKVGKDTVSIASPEFGGETNIFTVAGIIGYTPMAWHLGLKP
jgi:hypothetical protein